MSGKCFGCCEVNLGAPGKEIVFSLDNYTVERLEKNGKTAGEDHEGEHLLVKENPHFQ